MGNGMRTLQFGGHSETTVNLTKRIQQISQGIHRMHVVYIEDITWPSKDTEFLRGTQRRFPPKCIENTFQAIQSTFSSLEMHFKRCYKICICSVVLGQLESFRNYKGLRIIFPKILDAILSFTKVRIFLIQPLHRMFGSESFRFPFSAKNRQTWVLKCEKLNLRISQRIYQICYENCT